MKRKTLIYPNGKKIIIDKTSDNRNILLFAHVIRQSYEIIL